MEYNVLNNGDLVPSWQPPSRPNMKVVLLPTSYAAVPEHPYQSLRQGPYQGIQEVAYPNYQSPPRNLPTIQHQNLQTHSLGDVPYQQSLQEVSYQSLHTAPYHNLQVPSNMSHDVPAGQDSRQADENFDIVMQGLIEERAADTLSDTTCSTCGGHKQLKSSIEKLLSSQKQATKAWAEFAKDIISDIDEHRLWRISIEEKIDRLLERSNRDGSDLGILI